MSRFSVLETDVRLPLRRETVVMLVIGEPVRANNLDGGRPDADQGPWISIGGPRSIPTATVDGGAP